MSSRFEFVRRAGRRLGSWMGWAAAAAIGLLVAYQSGSVTSTNRDHAWDVPAQAGYQYSVSYLAAMTNLGGEAASFDNGLLREALELNRALQGSLREGGPAHNVTTWLLSAQGRFLEWAVVAQGVAETAPGELLQVAFGQQEDETLEVIHDLTLELRAAYTEVQAWSLQAGAKANESFFLAPALRESGLNVLHQLRAWSLWESSLVEMTRPYASLTRVEPVTWHASLKEAETFLDQVETLESAGQRVADPLTVRELRQASTEDKLAYWLAAGRAFGTQPGRMAISTDSNRAFSCVNAWEGWGTREFCPDGEGPIQVLSVDLSSRGPSLGFYSWVDESSEVRTWARHGGPDVLENLVVRVSPLTESWNETQAVGILGARSSRALAALSHGEFDGPVILSLEQDGQVLQRVMMWMVPLVGVYY